LIFLIGEGAWSRRFTPAEPHEFEATLQLTAGALSDAVSFRMLNRPIIPLTLTAYAGDGD
jgi:hypothetical protein